MIYAAVNGEAAGFAALTDTERAGIRDMVTELKAGSVPPCFSRAISRRLPIALRLSPVLMKSRRSACQKRMGGVGSGIAVNASDIVLVHDDIRAVPYIVRLSKRMMNTIRLNSTFSLTPNFIAIALAATGMMGPMAGALVHNASSVAVIINSAWLLKGRHQKGGMAD